MATLAGRLRAAGVRRGDVVAWQLPNGAPAVVLYRACWRLGAIAAPLHHRLGAAEVSGALDQVAPVLVLATPDMPAADMRRGPHPAGRRRGSRPCSICSTRPPPSTPAPRPARGSDLAVALFTSGSTGVPKAALHTHRGLGYKAALMVGIHGLDGGDAVLMPAPLAHVSGLLNGVLLPAAAGIPSVLMAAWDADEGLRLIEEERVTFMGAPPVFFSQMTASSRFRPEAVASLRLVSTGGASVSPAFVDATADAFACRVKRTYGSTEAPTVTTSGPTDSLDRARDTDGHATGEVEITVHDPATGAPPGAGPGRGTVAAGPRALRRLRRPRRHGQGHHHAGALVPHRGPGRPRRRRLAPGHRPAVRHHHQGGREHLGLGGGGHPRGPPLGTPRRGRGRPRSGRGRAGGRLRGDDGPLRPDAPAGPGSPSGP